jgi:DMSO/TMAO reductase YedYZ molybdopterin-dependent catalytic subunit
MTSEPKNEPKKTRNRRLWKGLPILALGLILIVAAVLVYAEPWDGGSSEGDIDWNLTIIGVNSENVTLSLKELRAMEPTMGQGGFFTTTGVVHGPYSLKGVSIEDLCDLVGGLGPSDGVLVSAMGTDGYSSFFERDEIDGNIATYEYNSVTGNLEEVPHERLGLMVVYEQDGKPLSSGDGRPLRLAVAGSESLLTEGFRWVMWVDQVEVVRYG